jgi:PilZ domain
MTTESEQDPGKPRRAPRQKSFLRGMVYFNNRRSSFDCLIRDITPEGARLVFSSPVTTPDVIELYIPQKEQTLTARVMWRNGEEIGLSFAQALVMEQTADAGDLNQRVARLEAEIAALKRVVKKLKIDADPDAEVA